MVGIILAILLIIFGVLCMGVSGLEEGRKRKIESKGWLAVGIICLIAGMFFFYVSSCKLEMRRRLNEPITSEAQLYGYKITDKRYIRKKSSDDEPEKNEYFNEYSIDVKNILPFSIGTFRNVEVSEEIFPKLIKGKSYLP